MPPDGSPGPSLPATPALQALPRRVASHPRVDGSPFSPHSFPGQKAPKINSGHLLAAPACWGRGLGQADPHPAPPGLGCAVTRVSGKCRRVRAGRPGCRREGTHTRDTHSRFEDRPTSAHPRPPLLHGTFPSAQSSSGGWGALPPGASGLPWGKLAIPGFPASCCFGGLLGFGGLFFRACHRCLAHFWKLRESSHAPQLPSHPQKSQNLKNQQRSSQPFSILDRFPHKNKNYCSGLDFHKSKMLRVLRNKPRCAR